MKAILMLALLPALTSTGRAQTNLLPREPAPNGIGQVSAPSLKPAEPAPNRMPVGNPVPLPPPELIPPPVRIGRVPVQVPGVARDPFAGPPGAAYTIPGTPVRPAGGVSSSYRAGVRGAATTTLAPATGRLGGIRGARGCASGSG